MFVSIAVCCLNAKETRSAAILRQDSLLPCFCSGISHICSWLLKPCNETLPKKDDDDDDDDIRTNEDLVEKTFNIY